jgi:hypothetical protein
MPERETIERAEKAKREGKARRSRHGGRKFAANSRPAFALQAPARLAEA